jgi:hypothetical protein
MNTAFITSPTMEMRELFDMAWQQVKPTTAEALELADKRWPEFKQRTLDALTEQ